MPRWKSFVTDGATHPESEGNNVIIKREFSPTATCSNCLSSQSDGKAVTGTPGFYAASSQSLDATFPQSADSVPSQPPTLVRKMVSKAPKMIQNKGKMVPKRPKNTPDSPTVPKMTPKVTRKVPKMTPNWSQNDPKMAAKAPQKRPTPSPWGWWVPPPRKIPPLPLQCTVVLQEQLSIGDVYAT